MENIIKKASILVEAIPYIHAFRKKIFVVKYGGSILENDTIRKYIFEDLVFLSYVGIRTILVHGGGPYINARLKESGIEAIFCDGIRVTNKQTLDIVTEELDNLNQKIVSEIKTLKGDVTGLKGYENIIHVDKKRASQDLGYVGEIKKVDHDIIKKHLKKGKITVVSPMGVCGEKMLYNINADDVASAIAVSLSAEKLVLLTNVRGVLRNLKDHKSLISTLQTHEAEELKKKNIIREGMIPKVNACIATLKRGVHKTHIVDASLRHAMLLEIFTDQGIGTQIIKTCEK